MSIPTLDRTKAARRGHEPDATPHPSFTDHTDAGDALDRTRPSSPNPASDGVPNAEDQIAHILQLVASVTVIDDGSANLFTTMIHSQGELYETRILAQRHARLLLAQNSLAESMARLDAAQRRFDLAELAHGRAVDEERSISRDLLGSWSGSPDTTTPDTTTEDN